MGSLLTLQYDAVALHPPQELLRQLCREGHSLARCGVGEGQRVRMQHQTRHLRALGAAVDGIAAHRVPDVLGVHADLMRPSGEDVHVQ